MALITPHSGFPLSVLPIPLDFTRPFYSRPLDLQCVPPCADNKCNFFYYMALYVGQCEGKVQRSCEGKVQSPKHLQKNNCRKCSLG